MIYRFIDIPKFIPLETYHASIESMKNRLLDNNSVKSIFQVGGISTPGISDIDFFVVFKNGASLSLNPVKELTAPANTLFTHRLFGTVEKFATQTEQFTYFGKYEFLGGDQFQPVNYSSTQEEAQLLRHQIAIEYLIKAWYSHAIGMIFNTVKLRNFLLHAKAIMLDLEFLSIKSGNLVNCIKDIMEVRRTWFSNPASNKTLSSLVQQYDKGLLEEISGSIDKYKFYLPKGSNIQLSKRITLKPALYPEVVRHGLLLPAAFVAFSNHLWKIQNKLNRFSVHIPVTSNDIPEIITKRFLVLNEAFTYNQNYLPGFLCTGHAMNLFSNEN